MIFSLSFLIIYFFSWRTQFPSNDDGVVGQRLFSAYQMLVDIPASRREKKQWYFSLSANLFFYFEPFWFHNNYNRFEEKKRTNWSVLMPEFKRIYRSNGVIIDVDIDVDDDDDDRRCR